MNQRHRQERSVRGGGSRFVVAPVGSLSTPASTRAQHKAPLTAPTAAILNQRTNEQGSRTSSPSSKSGRGGLTARSRRKCLARAHREMRSRSPLQAARQRNVIQGKALLQQSVTPTPTPTHAGARGHANRGGTIKGGALHIHLPHPRWRNRQTPPFLRAATTFPQRTSTTSSSPNTHTHTHKKKYWRGLTRNADKHD